jgi:hypothetical protein
MTMPFRRYKSDWEVGLLSGGAGNTSAILLLFCLSSGLLSGGAGNTSAILLLFY